MKNQNKRSRQPKKTINKSSPRRSQRNRKNTSLKSDQSCEDQTVALKESPERITDQTQELFSSGQINKEEDASTDIPGFSECFVPLEDICKLKPVKKRKDKIIVDSQRKTSQESMNGACSVDCIPETGEACDTSAKELSSPDKHGMLEIGSHIQISKETKDSKKTSHGGIERRKHTNDTNVNKDVHVTEKMDDQPKKPFSKRVLPQRSCVKSYTFSDDSSDGSDVQCGQVSHTDILYLDNDSEQNTNENTSEINCNLKKRSIKEASSSKSIPKFFKSRGKLQTSECTQPKKGADPYAFEPEDDIPEIVDYSKRKSKNESDHNSPVEAAESTKPDDQVLPSQDSYSESYSPVVSLLPPVKQKKTLHKKKFPQDTFDDIEVSDLENHRCKNKKGKGKSNPKKDISPKSTFDDIDFSDIENHELSAESKKEKQKGKSKNKSPKEINPQYTFDDIYISDKENYNLSKEWKSRKLKGKGKNESLKEIPPQYDFVDTNISDKENADQSTLCKSGKLKGKGKNKSPKEIPTQYIFDDTDISDKENDDLSKDSKRGKQRGKGKNKSPKEINPQYIFDDTDISDKENDNLSKACKSGKQKGKGKGKSQKEIPTQYDFDDTDISDKENHNLSNVCKSGKQNGKRKNKSPKELPAQDTFDDIHICDKENDNLSKACKSGKQKGKGKGKSQKEIPTQYDFDDTDISDKENDNLSNVCKSGKQKGKGEKKSPKEITLQYTFDGTDFSDIENHDMSTALVCKNDNSKGMGKSKSRKENPDSSSNWTLNCEEKSEDKTVQKLNAKPTPKNTRKRVNTGIKNTEERLACKFGFSEVLSPQDNIEVNASSDVFINVNMLKLQF